MTSLGNKKVLKGGGVIILLLIWFLGSKGINNSVILPNPVETLKATIQIIKAEEFLKIILSSMTRLFLSFLISMGLGVIVGSISGNVKMIEYILSPFLQVMRSLPTMSVIILALIWLEGEGAPLLIGFLVTFPMIYDSIVNCWGEMDKKLIEMAKIYNVGIGNCIKDIYIPFLGFRMISMLPSVIGLNFKVIIASEVIGQPNFALGSSLQMEKMYLNTSGVLAWTLIVIFIGVFIEKLLKIIDKKINRWRSL